MGREFLALPALTFLAAFFHVFISCLDVDFFALAASDYSAVAHSDGFQEENASRGPRTSSCKTPGERQSGSRRPLYRAAFASVQRGAYYLSCLRNWCPRVRIVCSDLTHKWKLQSGSAVDEALVKYGAIMYELGEDAGPLRAANYGVALFRPDLQFPAKNPLPKASRALKGFSRLVPSKASDPLPWLVLVLFCDYWLSQKMPLLAAAALLQFDTYFPPGETLALKKSHVLSPVRNAGVAHRRWELAVCPATELGTT